MILKEHLVNVYQTLSTLSALAQCSVVRKTVAKTQPSCLCLFSFAYLHDFKEEEVKVSHLLSTDEHDIFK